MTMKVEKSVVVNVPLSTVHNLWAQFAKTLEEAPDHPVAGATEEGATSAGEVSFDEVGPSRTEVRLALEYEPEGRTGKGGNRLRLVEKRAEGDLERFKEFVESPRRVAEPPRRGLIGAIPVGMPPRPGDHGLLPTDAAAGFGDPDLEETPGVVSSHPLPSHQPLSA